MDDKGGSDSGGPQKTSGEAQELRQVTAGVMGGGLLYMALMGGGVLVWVLTILTTIYSSQRVVIVMDGIERTPGGLMIFTWRVFASPFVLAAQGDSRMVESLMVGLVLGAVLVGGGRWVAKRAVRK